GQYGSNRSQNAKYVSIENPLGLLDGEGFHEPKVAETRIIDQYIDAAGSIDHTLNATLYRTVLRNIQFVDVEAQSFLFRHFLQCARGCGVSALSVPHGCEGPKAVAG